MVSKGFHEPLDKPKRFYKGVEARATDGGFAVLLDGRPIRTPRGARFAVPTLGLAEQVAAEWAGQGETIEMAQMHLTRLTNTALDALPGAREATADQVAQYAGSDLLCYFAEGPQALVERQNQCWEPVLGRAERELELRFVRASGVVHREQPPQTLARVRELALEMDEFHLAGLAFGTSLFGSAVLGFAVRLGWLGGEAALDLSRLDESFQEEQWGVDAEAAERTERLRTEARMLERWFQALDAPAA